jgi:tRNA nucleotidyltransferase (CCA-adding enzyme)
MSDYNFLMESRFSPEQLQVVNHLSRLAPVEGVNLYLFGGGVRDLLLGHLAIRDLDFVAEGNPHKMLRRLETGSSAADQNVPVVEQVIVNKRLNHAEIYFQNGVRADLGPSQIDKPGRPADLEPAMIFDFLKSRDFSVDAMAISLHPNSRGLLLDPTNGDADIGRRELRSLASRGFAEDPVRIFRLLRLSQRLDLKPDDRTRTHFDSALESRAWEQLSPEQQSTELRAVLTEEQPGRVFKLYSDRGILSGLDKKLGSTNIPYDRFAKTRSILRTVVAADILLLNFLVLVEKMDPSNKARLAAKILVDHQSVKTALGMERAGKALAQQLMSAKTSLPSQVYSLLTDVPQSELLYVLGNYSQEKIQSKIKNFLFKYPLVRANLPRADLQALGVPFGAKFDRILEQIFFAQLDGKIRTPQQAAKELKDLAGFKEPQPSERAKPSKPKTARRVKPAAPSKGAKRAGRSR